MAGNDTFAADLAAIQKELDDAKAAVAEASNVRSRIIREAVAAGYSVYWVAQILGVNRMVVVRALE